MSSTAEQAKAAREGVLLVGAKDRSLIVATGKDRTSWLNGLVTCDLAKLAPGRAAYGLLVEKKGRIQADLYVLQGKDALALAVPAALREALMATLDHYLIMEDVSLEPRDEAVLFAHGPGAAALVASAKFGGELDLLGTGGAVLAGLPEAALPATGEVVMGDDEGWDALRVERGLPRFGAEVDTTMYPQEAGLEKRAVAFDKGCYLGQEVVYMLENRGHVKKKLVPLDLEGAAVPERGAAVSTPEGEAVGDVRTAVHGPLHGKVAAIATVKWSHAKPGTELRVGDAVARVRDNV